jgi:hypothetical protein
MEKLYVLVIFWAGMLAFFHVWANLKLVNYYRLIRDKGIIHLSSRYDTDRYLNSLAKKLAPIENHPEVNKVIKNYNRWCFAFWIWLAMGLIGLYVFDRFFYEH